VTLPTSQRTGIVVEEELRVQRLSPLGASQRFFLSSKRLKAYDQANRAILGGSGIILSFYKGRQMIGIHSVCFLLVLSVFEPPWRIGDDAERSWPAELPGKRFFRQIAKMAGEHVEAYGIQEIAQEYGGDYDKAVNKLSEAIRVNPNDPISYNNRGLAYHGKGDREKALKDFCEAIRLDPKMAAAYTNRGEVYAAKKEYEKAIQDHTKAISLDGECEEAFGNRGRAYLKKKDYGRAIDDYTAAIHSPNWGWPAKPSLFLERGIAYGAKKDSDNAIGDFSEAISLHMWYRRQDWRCPQAYFYRGIAYLARKKYHLGFEDLKDYWRSITDKASNTPEENW
jgi:tetratricopeptide (TPR) repeat protein